MQRKINNIGKGNGTGQTWIRWAWGVQRETDGGVHALYRKNGYNNHCLQNSVQQEDDEL